MRELLAILLIVFFSCSVEPVEQLKNDTVELLTIQQQVDNLASSIEYSGDTINTIEADYLVLKSKQNITYNNSLHATGTTADLAYSLLPMWVADSLARIVFPEINPIPELQDCDDYALAMKFWMNYLSAKIYGVKHSAAFGIAHGYFYNNFHATHAINFMCTKDSICLFDPQYRKYLRVNEGVITWFYL